MTPLPAAALPHLIAARDALHDACIIAHEIDHPNSGDLAMTTAYIAKLAHATEPKEPKQ